MSKVSNTSTNGKKSRKARVFKIILIAILSFIVLSFAITKIIYDKIFTRYDAPLDNGETAEKELTEDLWETVMSEEEWRKEYADCYAIREPIEFYVEETKLQGYLYRSKYFANADTAVKGKTDDNAADTDAGTSEVGLSGTGEIQVSDGDYGTDLVVIAPGMHADCDSFLPQIDTFLGYGYDVWIFDPMGCCHSDGDSQVGFVQEYEDLVAAVDCIRGRHDYDNIYLFGHSRGGFAVCAYEQSHDDITAVVSVSGINSSMDAIMGKSVEYVGPVAYGNYPFLLLYQMTLHSPSLVTMQVDEVIEESGIPTLIVQGSDDTIAPVDNFSIYSHKDEIASELVEYELCSEEGASEHRDLMYDADGTSSDDLMEVIHAFYQESAKGE